jgi:hypothetical protein
MITFERRDQDVRRAAPVAALGDTFLRGPISPDPSGEIAVPFPLRSATVIPQM